MKWYNTVVYMAIAIVLTASVESKGGRSGGGGRSGSRSRSSGSGRSWHSSSSSSHSRTGSGTWFRGIFHSRPRVNSYIPIYRRTSYNTVQSTAEAESYFDSKQLLAGYSVGKVISSDFFSLFNIVSDISKYTDDRKNYAAANIIETTTEHNLLTTDKTSTETPYNTLPPF